MLSINRGEGGRHGGGGGSKPPDMSAIKSCLSNVILADVSEHFQFFLYAVAAEDPNGMLIESRHRRKFLFDQGFWNGIHAALSPKEKEDLQRVIFFQGSFFYSARKIPGLEPENLPLELPVPTEKAEGDSIKITQVIHYVTPLELLRTGSEDSTKEGEVSFDKRCADCLKSFKDVGGMLQHW
jgi:hypothetical protein